MVDRVSRPLNMGHPKGFPVGLETPDGIERNGRMKEKGRY